MKTRMKNTPVEQFQEGGIYSGLGVLIAEGDANIEISGHQLQDDGFYKHSVYISENVEGAEQFEVAQFDTYTASAEYVIYLANEVG